VVPARVLVTLGTLLLAASMFLHGTLTAESGATNLYLPVTLRGFGFGLIFTPAVTVAFAGVPAGELSHGTALFNLARQLGGSVGIALVATLLTTSTARHRAALVEHVTASDVLTTQRLHATARLFRRAGTDSLTASRRALEVLDRQVTRQAVTLAYRDAFRLLGVVVLCSVPLVLLLRPPRSDVAASHVDVH
jgi:DHA2 family multidrug resistance protein